MTIATEKPPPSLNENRPCLYSPLYIQSPVQQLAYRKYSDIVWIHEWLYNSMEAVIIEVKVFFYKLLIKELTWLSTALSFRFRRKFIKKEAVLTAVRLRPNLWLPSLNQDHWSKLIDKSSGSIWWWPLPSLCKTHFPYFWWHHFSWFSTSFESLLQSLW